MISVSYVDTQSMIADAFTKPLGDAAFLRHRQHLVAKSGVSIRAYFIFVLPAFYFESPRRRVKTKYSFIYDLGPTCTA